MVERRNREECGLQDAHVHTHTHTHVLIDKSPLPSTGKAVTSSLCETQPGTFAASENNLMACCK